MSPLTNKLGLPEAVVRAVTNDPYSHGRAHISATSLYGPPKPRLLRRLAPELVEEDVADRLWALVGQIGHGILERAIHRKNSHEVLESVREILASPSPDDRAKIGGLVDAYFGEAERGDVVERRLFGDWAGWTVSGQMDVFRGATLKLCDFKFTSVWTVMMGGRREWEYQLNTYAALLRRNGETPQALEIVAIFRDWKKGDAQRDPSYPQRQVEVVPIPLWSPEEADRWIEERVRVHQAAEAAPDPQELLCSDDERWIRTSTWAVVNDAGRAVPGGADHQSEESAVAFLDGLSQQTYATGKHKGKSKSEGLQVVHRPGFPVRCAGFCNVAPICRQWARDYRSLAT